MEVQSEEGKEAFAFFIDQEKVTEILKKDGINQHYIDAMLGRILYKVARPGDWQLLLIVSALMVDSLTDKGQEQCH
jgi:hypothetical protein